MMIGSMAGTNNNMQAGHSGMNMQADAVTKSIQRQIANAQKQLQEISSNKDMAMEEKMKKRQEIQKEIADLNLQLRQHQIEQRKEQQSKNTSMDNIPEKEQSTEATKSGKNDTITDKENNVQTKENTKKDVAEENSPFVSYTHVNVYV